MNHLLQRILSELILPPFGPVLLIWLGIWVSRRRPRMGWAIDTAQLTALAKLLAKNGYGQYLLSLLEHGLSR